MPTETNDPLAELRRLCDVPPPPPRACATCRFVRRDHSGLTLRLRCEATDHWCDHERDFNHTACGKEGRLWSARPPARSWQPGVIERVWRWLFGGHG